MKLYKYLKSVSLILLCAGLLTTSTVYIEKASAQPTATSKPVVQGVQTSQAIAATPLEIVNSPSKYLNKNIVMKAVFIEFIIPTKNFFDCLSDAVNSLT